MKAKANLFRSLLVLPVVVLVAVAVALFGVGLRTAETQTTPSYYEVQNLGAFCSGYCSTSPSETDSIPYGINDFGHVVGEAYTGRGSCCGQGGQFNAFLYDGQMHNLGTLGDASSLLMSSARAINDSDQVVGYSYNGNWNEEIGIAEWHAFLYDSTNGMKDLGTLGGTSSSASGINDSGQVVGYSYTAGDQNTHAFLYEDGEMKDLGTLGGSGSYASAINDSGQVVGGSSDSSGQYHAFLYDSTNGMKDLGTLGGSGSHAKAINDSGQVIGESYDSSGQWHAFLYQNEEMIDLDTRLLPDNNGSVWTLNSSPFDSAYGINNEGQIVVEGWRDYYTSDGFNWGWSALLLTPTSDIPPADSQAPSPPTITSPQNNTYDSDGSFSVSGSAEAASTVELFEGATSKGTTKADSSSGAWSIALSGASEGAHTYSAKAKDAAGNTSSASNSLTVTVDKTAPTVSSVSPASGATKVARNTSVTATFSEKMLPGVFSSTSTAVKLVKNGTATPISATVSYNDSTKTVTITPSSRLAANTKYTVKLSPGVVDLAGNELALYTWSFTTGSK